VFQDGFVGEAAIDTDDQRAFCSGGVLIEFFSEVMNALGALLGEIAALLFLPIGLLGFFGGIGSGSLGCGAMLKVDGDGAGTGGSGVFGNEDGALQKSQSPNEVDVEGGSLGIVPPGGSVDLAPAFVQEGVIHRDDEGSGGVLLGLHGLPSDPKERFRIEAPALEETEIGGPIGELPTGGGEKSGEGVPPQAKKGAEGQPSGAFPGSILGEGGPGLLPEFVQSVHQGSCRFFLRAEGGGSRRRRTNWALSSMSHSTVSPRWNSMAWATAAGKLTYHCSLAFRLMSWTLVGYPMAILLVSSHITRYQDTTKTGRNQEKISPNVIFSPFSLVKGQTPGLG